MSCIRQNKRPIEALYEAMMSYRSKVIGFVCTSCRMHGSIVKRLMQHEYKSTRAEDDWLASTSIGTERPNSCRFAKEARMAEGRRR